MRPREEGAVGGVQVAGRGCRKRSTQIAWLIGKVGADVEDGGDADGDNGSYADAGLFGPVMLSHCAACDRETVLQ